MLRRTIASVLTVVPGTKANMRDGPDGPGSFGGPGRAHRAPRPLAAFRPAAEPHLALGAEVGRAAADDDPHHLAVARGAGLALAGVDQEALLHRSPLAAAVAVVVDRGAAGVDPRLERGDDPVAQRLPVLGLHRAGGRERVQAGPVERLVGVDVADPGDLRLVEQKRLQRRRAAGGDAAELLRGEVRRE